MFTCPVYLCSARGVYALHGPCICRQPLSDGLSLFYEAGSFFILQTSNCFSVVALHHLQINSKIPCVHQLLQMQVNQAQTAQPAPAAAATTGSSEPVTGKIFCWLTSESAILLMKSLS